MECSQIGGGDFSPLREWLRTKIHTVGSVHSSPDELLVAVTGAPVSAKPFLAYLREKYSALYAL